MKSQFVTKVDLKLVLKEALTLPYKVDGSDILMANEQSGGIPGWVDTNCPNMRAAINELVTWRGKKAMHLMVNKVPHNCVCPVHVDTVKGSPERWHLPIVTSIHAFWWDEKGGLANLLVGNWYGPMPYNGKHTVGNFGPDVRVHLIVDLEP